MMRLYWPRKIPHRFSIAPGSRRQWRRLSPGVL
jgi:hypothetical protein